MIRMTTATRSRRWMRAPPKWPMKPRSQSTTSMIIIVQSIDMPQQKFTPSCYRRNHGAKHYAGTGINRQRSKTKGKKACLSLFISLTFRTLRFVPPVPGSARLKELNLGRRWDSSPSQNCMARLAVFRLAGGLE